MVDQYNEKGSWKDVIHEERLMVDSEGFQYKYVPKDQIMHDDLTKKNMASAGKKSRKNTATKDEYIYVKKN